MLRDGMETARFRDVSNKASDKRQPKKTFCNHHPLQQTEKTLQQSAWVLGNRGGATVKIAYALLNPSDRKTLQL